MIAVASQQRPSPWIILAWTAAIGWLLGILWWIKSV